MQHKILFIIWLIIAGILSVIFVKGVPLKSGGQHG